MRFIPKDIDGLRTIVNDERLPDEMKVEADEGGGKNSRRTLRQVNVA